MMADRMRMSPVMARAKRIASRLAGAGLFNIFGASVLNKVISFLSGMIVVRLIPQVDYGVYSYAYNILNFIMLLNGFGVLGSVLQFCSERAFLNRRCEVEALGLVIGLGFDTLLCIGIISVPLFVELPVAGSSRLLQLFALFPLCSLMVEMQSVCLRSQLRNREYALATNLNTVLIMFGSVMGAWLGSSTGLIIGRTLAQLVTAITVALLFRVPGGVACLVQKRPRRAFAALTWAEKTDFTRISFGFLMSSVVTQSVYLLGTASMGTLSGDARMVALFQTSLAIPTALNFIPTSLITFVYPYFARNKDDGSWVLRRYVQMTAGIAALAGVVAIGIAAFAPQVLMILYGADYLPAVPALRLLMLGWFIAAVLRIPAGNLLSTQRKILFGAVSGAVAALILVAANAVLVPSFGLVGAAWAQVVVFTVTGVANTCYFLYVVRSKMRAAGSQKRETQPVDSQRHESQ